MKFMRSIFFAAGMILSIFIGGATAQKITAEEIIANHLNSIGPAKAREARKSQVIFSDAQFTQQGLRGGSGKAVFVSDENRLLVGMNFESNDYPIERLAFDGKKTRIGYIRPGTRSILGGFLFSYDEIFKEGLFGGVLSSSWALIKTKSKNPKLIAEGTKKIDGKEFYVIEYSPKNGSDLEITMYFDKDKFYHVRTEYHRMVAARAGPTIDNSARQSSDRFRLTEDFSEFQKMGDLMMPSVYKISYAYTSTSTTQFSGQTNRDINWNFKVTNFSFNQPLDDAAFDIESK